MAKKFDPKAKARKQKIIAIAGAVLLLALLAFQVPRTLKMLNKKPPPSAAAVAAPALPVPGIPLPPATGVALPASAPSQTLSDTDPAPSPSAGQLVAFDRFASKDPFAPQLQVCEPGTCPADSPAPAPSPRKPIGTNEPSGPAPGDTSAQPTAAVITVNGVKETVDVSETFPEVDPVFQLVSLTASSAKIGVAGGSLGNGAATVTLKKGKPLTLMNTADGARYKLVLVSTS